MNDEVNCFHLVSRNTEYEPITWCSIYKFEIDEDEGERCSTCEYNSNRKETGGLL